MVTNLLVVAMYCVAGLVLYRTSLASRCVTTCMLYYGIVGIGINDLGWLYIDWLGSLNPNHVYARIAYFVLHFTDK